MNRRQRDNGRERERNQENHPGQTPLGEHTRGSFGGNTILHDGASSSYNPPNIQNHGRDATHGYTTHSQRHPYCSGRTGMHSQTAAACGLPAGHDDQTMDFTHSSEPVQFFTQESLLRSVQGMHSQQAATGCALPADQKDAFMPQYDQYNDQHNGRQVSHVYSSHPSHAFPRSFGGTGELYAGRASSRPDRRDADLPRHNPRKYHGKALHGHSSYQQLGRLSRSSGPGARLLYSGAPSSDVPSCDSRLSKSNVGNYH